MKKILILTALFCLCLTGCIDSETTKKIEIELEKINKEISETRETASHYGSGSLLYNLVSLRLSVYEQTKAMLEQKKIASWFVPFFSYSVNGTIYSPPTDVESKVSAIQKKLGKTRSEISDLENRTANSGGLLLSLASAQIEMKSIMVSQLEYELAGLNFGFPTYIPAKHEDDSYSPSSANNPAPLENKNEKKPQDKALEKMHDSFSDNTSSDLRHVSWGMTMAQVKASEKGSPSRETEDNLAYSDQISGMEAIVVYTFVEDKLVRANYVFAQEHSNKNDYILDFTRVKNALTDKYGTPKFDKVLWRNDLYKSRPDDWGFAISLGHLLYTAWWETKETEIDLSLSGENYQHAFVLQYTSIKLKKLEGDRIKKSHADKL